MASEISGIAEGPRPLGLRRINPPHLIGVTLMHASCLLAPSTFRLDALAVALLLYWLCCGLGISMGYHRLFSHRSFQTSAAFRYTLAILGMMNLQGGPLSWVGFHRVHHSDADGRTDPHSPRHGFWWSHVVWCVVWDSWDRDVTQAAKDLKEDRVLVWLDNLFPLQVIVLALILYGLGGLPWVIWGISVRIVFAYHATWFVNSACHLWGYRSFEIADGSRNNPLIALVTWGEGWHNNHHAHPRSARHGLRPFEIDLTWLQLKVLEKLGVVWALEEGPELDS